jgi:protein gp37
MAKTKIEWATDVWNPIVGCDKVSTGCKNCYAIRDAHRMAGNPNEKIAQVYRGLTEIRNGAPNWTGQVRFIEDRLDQPLRWKCSRMIFVNSQSDLFHENVPYQFLDKVFAVMALAPQHTFQVLTKRAKRMFAYLDSRDRKLFVLDALCKIGMGAKHLVKQLNLWGSFTETWPLKNVWLGVSCENQETADERIPILLQTPAAVRWISAEPLLGAIDLFRIADPVLKDTHFHSLSKKPGIAFHGNGIDWVVVNGESGSNARPMHPD